MIKEEVGNHWVTRFVKRHSGKLISVYLESIDYARRVADNGKHFKHYFTTVSLLFHLSSSILAKYKPDFEKLEKKIRKYRIKSSNIYNIDEKGFLIGIYIALRRIVAAAQLKTKKLLGASQDKSREFISLLTCICADRSALTPALIY